MTLPNGTTVATFQGGTPALVDLPTLAAALGVPTSDELVAITDIAASAISGIEALADDGVVTASEKVSKLIPLDSELDETWSLLDTKAASITGDTDLPSARVLAAAARGAWLAYRNALAPAWNDTTADTPVDRGAFDAKLESYRTGLTRLADALRLAASRTAHWSATYNDDGNRPEDGATVGGTLGVDIKDAAGNVLTPTQILNPALTLTPGGALSALIGGVPTLLGQVTLPDLGAASDAARRQLEASLASISAAVAQLSAGQAIVQNVFRDAGLYNDPASGIAKLFAIESRAQQITNLSVTLNAALGTIGLKADVNYVNQAILTAQLSGANADLSSLLVRLTSAETNISGLQASVQLKADATVVTGLQGIVGSVQQSLTALTATVSTKADQTIVDAQGARLTLAEQTISAFDGASISQAVTASRQAPANADVAGATTILDLINGVQNAMLTQQGIAQARQELGARVGSAFDAIASLSITLGAQIGAVNAAVGVAQTAQVTGDQALATSIASYQASTGASLASVNQALVAQTATNNSVAGSIAAYGTTLAGHTTTLTTYGQSINGLSAKYGVEINANGVVTGFTLNNGNGRTDLTFVVDGFKIAQPDGTGARTVFSVADTGEVQMHSVEVDTLKVNTAVVPIVSTSSTQTSGTSTTLNGLPNAFVTLFQKSITVPAPGLIRIECNLAQSFTGGMASTPWQLYLSVNGAQLPESIEGGTVPGDSVTSVGFYYAAAAGTYVLSVTWGAHTTIIAKGRSFCALGLSATTLPPDTSDGGNYIAMGSGSTGTGGVGGGGGSGGGGFDTVQQ